MDMHSLDMDGFVYVLQPPVCLQVQCTDTPLHQCTVVPTSEATGAGTHRSTQPIDTRPAVLAGVGVAVEVLLTSLALEMALTRAPEVTPNVLTHTWGEMTVNSHINNTPGGDDDNQ